MINLTFKNADEPKIYFVAVNKKLWEATVKGDINSMKTALADGAQLKCREHIIGYGSSTCLYMAVVNGHLEATMLLLEERANVDAVNGNHQQTPMKLASAYNKPQIVQLLLEHNGNTELMDRYGWTALHWAAINAHLSVVQMLVGKSNVNERDDDGKTPLGRAEERPCTERNYDTVIQFLRQNGATMQQLQLMVMQYIINYQ